MVGPQREPWRSSALMEAFEQPLLVLDGKARVVTANSAFLSMLEVADGYIQSKRLLELGSPDRWLEPVHRLVDRLSHGKAETGTAQVELGGGEAAARRFTVDARRMPVCGQDDDAILVSFTDVTRRELSAVETAARTELADKLFDTIGEGLLVLRADLRVHSANRTFYELFQTCAPDTIGQMVYDLGNGQWAIPELRRMLEEILPEQSTIDGYVVRHAFESIGQRAMRISARRLDHLDLILLAIRDVTAEESAARRQHEAEERHRFLLEVGDRLNGLDDPTAVAAAACQLLGRELGVDHVEYAHPDRGPGERFEPVRAVWSWGDAVSTSASSKGPAFRRTFADEIGRGKIVAIADLTSDPRTAEAIAPGAGGVAALLLVPLARRQLSTVLSLLSAKPRAWRRSEIRLAYEVALRACEAIVRSRAEEELRRSEERLRVASEAAGFGVYEFDFARGRVIRSPALCRILGVGTNETEISLEEALATVHPDDRERVHAAFDAATRQPTSYELEFRLVRPDAGIRWVLDRGEAFAPVDPETGRARRGAGTIIDITDRKRSEEALRESEARFRTMADEAPVMVWMTDAEGGCTFLSRSWYEFTGQTPETGLGDRWLDAVHHDDRSHTEAEYRRANAERTPVRLEYRLRRRDGTWRWAIDAATPRITREGRFLGYIGSVLDISDRKMAEEALATSEATLRRIFESSPDAIFVLSEDFTILDASRATLAIQGCSRERVIGSRMREWVPSELVGELDRMLGGIASGDAPTLETELLTVDGGKVPVEIRGGRVAHGAGAWILLHVRDITERRRAEQRLRSSYDTYLGLIENNPYGVYLVDGNFRLAQVSAGAQRVFAGVRPLLGRDFSEVLRTVWAEPFAGEVLARFRHTLETGEPFRASETTEARGDTGELESYDWQIERVTLPDATFGVVCYFYDLTERKRHERQIRLLMREVNHRAKNMLGLVLAIAHQTAASGFDDFIGRFEERMHALAASQDLLVRSEWKGAPLRDLVQSQLAHFDDLIDDRIRLLGGPMTVGPEAAQTIGLALHELATNAGKYGALSGTEGIVTITWALETPDGGERTFRLDWTELRGPEVAPPSRTGFGTTVIRNMVQLNLDAEVDLEFPPSGLVWRLRCPARRVLEGWERGSASEVPASIAGPEVKSDRPSILIVEDEALLSLEIADLLTNAGFNTVGPAHSVAHGLELIEQVDCDAAVLDIHLGPHTSEPVARELISRRIPFVVLTAYARDQQPPVFRGAPRMTKPLRMHMLVAEVRRLLAPR